MIESRARGFTLIELLVVIAIIGLLSAVIVANLKSARERSVSANITSAMHQLQTALALYYADNAMWPNKAGDGRMVATNNDSGWNTFMTKLAPYLSNNFYNLPHETISGGVITQGYLYMKGTESTPVQIKMYNNSTHTYIGCVKIYDGYFIDANVKFNQNSFTLNDGGVDPDGIDHLEGHYVVDASIPASSCTSSDSIY